MSSPILRGRKTKQGQANDPDLIPPTPIKDRQKRPFIKKWEDRKKAKEEKVLWEKEKKEEEEEKEKEKKEVEEKEKQKGVKKIDFDNSKKTSTNNNSIDDQLDAIFGPTYEIELESQSLLEVEKNREKNYMQRKDMKDKSADQIIDELFPIPWEKYICIFIFFYDTRSLMYLWLEQCTKHCNVVQCPMCKCCANVVQQECNDRVSV